MRVLVTGGSGFIGSHLVEALVEKGYEVLCLVRESDDTTWIKDLKIQLVYGDVTDKESLLRAVKGVDYVYHLAAALLGADYEAYSRVNCTGTSNLAGACIESGLNLKRLLFVSSVAAGGPSGKKDLLTEANDAVPISNYGRTKSEAEKYLKSIGDKLPFTVIRLPVMYGPRDRGAIFSYFTIINKGLKPLLGRGVSNICYVKDAVRGMILAAESEKAKGETYLIANQGLFTRREIADNIEKALGKKAVTLRIPLPMLLLTIPFFWILGKLTGRIPMFKMRNYIDLRHGQWRYSTEKIEKELGFKAEYDIEKGMRSTTEWYRKNKYI